jgi:hypothetical protein
MRLSLNRFEWPRQPTNRLLAHIWVGGRRPWPAASPLFVASAMPQRHQAVDALLAKIERVAPAGRGTAGVNSSRATNPPTCATTRRRLA